MPGTPRDIRICFFGDSFVNGTLDASYQSWTGRVCAGLPLQVTHYNLGIRGNTALDIEQRWESESQRRWKPDTERRLVFSFGTNDCSLEHGRPRLSLEASVASADTILSAATQCCPVLLIGPPAVELEDHEASFARLQGLSNAYALLAAQRKVPYLDLFALSVSSEEWQRAVGCGDGVHPDPGGYALLAKWVQGWNAWQAWW
jgi:lysophospholipase L1-like esterase